ncbi:MAG: glycosyltransferase family 4 protein [bacterium]|nr:glycosyltransferase family 4 protein [bacterium]
MSKRILIATGIFPPDIGGPALYSQKLAEEFLKFGKKVTVLTYGKGFLKSSDYKIFGVSRLWPSGIRQLIYLFKLLIQVKESDALLAMDSLGAGLPAVIAGILFNKKVIIRMGGDFLWEKFVEFGQGNVTLTEFYKKNLHKRFPFLNRLITFTLKGASAVVFTTDFQKEIFLAHYGLNPDKTFVASNVFKKEAGKIQPENIAKTILWAGRFLKLKNLDFLLKIFKRLLPYNQNLSLELVGDGPEKKRIEKMVKSEKLDGKVKISPVADKSAVAAKIISSYFCILPSLSEVSPNFALECLGADKPVIITQETGIKEQFPGLMYADPKKEDSFFSAALRLLDKNTYYNYQKFISEISYQKTWQDLASEYLNLLK